MNEYKVVVMIENGCKQYETIVTAKDIVECAKTVGKYFPKSDIMSIAFQQMR